jgi:hypothetical protein
MSQIVIFYKTKWALQEKIPIREFRLTNKNSSSERNEKKNPEEA